MNVDTKNQVEELQAILNSQDQIIEELITEIVETKGISKEFLTNELNQIHLKHS